SGSPKGPPSSDATGPPKGGSSLPSPAPERRSSLASAYSSGDTHHTWSGSASGRGRWMSGIAAGGGAAANLDAGPLFDDLDQAGVVVVAAAFGHALEPELRDAGAGLMRHAAAAVFLQAQYD